MKKILLIDGFGYIFKSYYAFINRPLTNKNGENTSAIFGFFKSLISILNKEKPDYYLVALEGEGKCFRNNIFEEYKANRPPAPDDLKSQIFKIIELIKKLDIPNLSFPGFEADDIIGTISNKFISENDTRAIIFSSDKDLRQLVNDKIKITYTNRIDPDIKMLDEKGVIEKMGVKPSQVIDFLALTGDSSDNIPGVKGVGPKTAVNLLADYETLEGIYENIDKITRKSLHEKLVNDKEKAFLSKKLATIEKNVPIKIKLEDWKIKPLNLDNAKDSFIEDNLKSIIDAINDFNLNLSGTPKIPETLFDMNVDEKNNNDGFKKLEKDYEIISDIINIEKKFENIIKSKIICFDLETTGFDFLNDKIICISFANSDNAFVIPYYISETQQKDLNLSVTDEYINSLNKLLKNLFENKDLLKIGHNIKFDIKFLKTLDIFVQGPFFDTMLAEYCIDASHNILNMDDLAEKYLSYKTIHYKDVVENPKKETLQNVPIQEMVNYSTEDSDITFKLYEVLKLKIDESKELSNLFYNIEMPLMDILVNMEYYGVNIDTDYLKEFSKQLEDELIDIQKKLIDLAGEEFNPNSPKQIAEILFEKLGLPVVKKTKTGASTDVQVLQKLSYVHPLPGLLLEYRTMSKIKSTYSDSLPKMVNNKSGKIHTTYLQTGTQTGRLASKNPNLQNIPVKTEIGRKIRKAFVSSKDKILISADYSQIELFLLAELSRDPNLYDAFKNGEDIHTKTASLIFDKDVKDVTREDRYIGKTINFSVLYGQGPFRLSENLGIKRSDASNFINKYFANYSGVSSYMEQIRENCKKQGFAKTLWGRKRTVPEINDRNRMVQANGERIAVNTTIQGTAADLIKVSMIKIEEEFNKNNIKSKLILQVHDELIFEVLINEKENVIKIIKKCMEDGFDFTLKLKTSVKSGNNWGDLE